MKLFPVPDLPEIRPGDDIAALIEARIALEPTDVVVIASTIVSKAEDRRASLADFEPGPRATAIAEKIGAIAGEEKDPRFAQAVIEESEELLTEAPFLLSKTKFGHVGVNAGIDRSNTGDVELLLLPEKPSQSAATIRSKLTHKNPVIISDTCGRPFRHGQVGVTIGWDGMPASRDWRGEFDRDGHELGVTVESVIDELAAAANLIAGEGADGDPVVVVRDFAFGDHNGSQELYRNDATDFVRAALRLWEYEQD